MNYPTYIPTMQQPAAFMQRPQMMPAPSVMRPIYGAQSTQPVRVNGRAGAEAFYMGPNETAVLFDENEDVFFLKATDGAGYATVRPYRFEPMPEPGTAPAAEYATKAELEALQRELQDIKGVLGNGKQSVRAKVKPEPEE